MTDNIRVMVVDDHVLMRQGIKKLLEFDNKIEIVAEAGNGVECLEKIKVYFPDVILLDINMPEANGMEVLKRVREYENNIKIIILTGHDEIDYLVNAINLNVDGYLLKRVDISELKKAIYYVMDNKKYIQPELIPTLNYTLANRDLKKEKVESLTKREKEILIQVVSGMSNKEVALNLDISERTVKNHISNIFKKIEVSDRTQAAVFAIKNNIVKL
ncbi:MAG: response regulator transcription factor [Bacillus sp. (in: Bacteria)]|nr:response regulator transcription factor [Bacillus sp. (in: firmicutes)]MCM1425359.1 response regulator transcription factor [Eubacterium sp.]